MGGSRIAGAALLALACFGCRANPGGEGPAPEALPVEEGAAALAGAQEAFAVDLYRTVRDREGNLLVSPYSVHETLSIVRAGARGESAKHLDAALHLPAEGADAAWAALQKRVHGERAVTVRVGSGLWIDQSVALEDDFAAKATSVHGATVRRRSFDDVPGLIAEVNAWGRRQTDGMIEQSLPPDALVERQSLVLVNAVYFHGKWQKEFERADTKPEPFTTAGGTRVDVPLMTATSSFRYAADETVRSLAVPYRGASTELVVLLPTKEDGLGGLEASLSPESLHRWTTAGTRMLVRLHLPRFSFTTSTDLAASLTALGLGDLMDPGRADLKGIGTGPAGPLYVTRASQTALIDLDEEGTRAAALTLFTARSVGPSEPIPIEFRCDRPFLFVLRHVSTGAILFMGRVTSPPHV